MIRISLGILMFCVLLPACGQKEINLRYRNFERANLDVIVDPAKMNEDIKIIVGDECNETTKLLYGNQTLSVPAKSWWTSSQLHLKKGETATISASGEWTIWDGETPNTGPAGYASFNKYKGCNKGALVARVGLYQNSIIHCVGEDATVKAENDGILYLGMNDSASPSYHGGSIRVSVTSSGESAPTIKHAEVPDTTFCAVSSGWVELESADHFTFTVPAALADQNKETIQESLDYFDFTYKYHQQLVGGAQPYDGERIRFYPDHSITDESWMVVQNPIRFDPRALNAVKPSETLLLDIRNPESNSWDFAQAIGVAFSRVHGSNYQSGAMASQSWAGLFAIYSMNQLQKNDVPENLCYGRDDHLASGSFNDIQSSAMLQMCFMLELAEIFGWDAWTKFFEYWETTSEDDRAFVDRLQGKDRWVWVYNRMDELDIDNPTPTQVNWNLETLYYPIKAPYQRQRPSNVFFRWKL